MAVPDEGFKVNVGGHLIEDPGSGLTKVFEHVGKELVHGKVSAEMPVWDHEKQAWGSIRDRYSGSKAELKKVIKALLETPCDELDHWDDRPLRQWLHQYTDDQGVIDLFEFITVLECMTDEWWDHSASDNLYVRKMHFAETRHRRLLLLARPGLGRDVGRPGRRDHLPRRRAAARHRGGARRDREPRGQGRRRGPPAARCCRTSSSKRRSSRRRA